MILSDRSIREEIAAGRIIIEPFVDSFVQPSSVDLRIDRFFRVFRNHTMGYIDVKRDQEELTELVEIAPDDVFILHPGEFVLGSTLERVGLPSDLVARLEGKSSLGRLGLLIHSSLPGDEQILFRDHSGLRLRRIDELVQKQIEGDVAAFDPDTFEAAYFPVTGWFEGKADRIFEVTLSSGRSVRVTAGHNVFTLDCDGEIRKLRAQELIAGTLVAVPRRLPDPSSAPAEFDLRELVPEALLGRMILEGPTIEAAHRSDLVRRILSRSRPKLPDWYRDTAQLPADLVRMTPSVWQSLGGDDYLRPLGSTYRLPVLWNVDEDFAWLIGFYVAGGYRRRNHVVFANTNPELLSRVESTLSHFGLRCYRTSASITCCSTALSLFMEWIGTGAKGETRRIPPTVLGWQTPLLEAVLDGLLDGNETGRDGPRHCYWSSSPGLVSDLLYLASRLGIRATASPSKQAGHGLNAVSLPRSQHNLPAPVPLPTRLLLAARRRAGLSQPELTRELEGTRGGADSISDLETAAVADAARPRTLVRLAASCRELIPDAVETQRLSRLVDGDVAWDRVAGVVDTGSIEPVYDLEVRPQGRKIENFVAGSGGVFVSNTAGFVDASFDGHLTLELSNVANLPITLYPGMKIGQISFLRMTTAAEHPYGSKEAGSKYQHQRGPTASRYFENFRSEEQET